MYENRVALYGIDCELKQDVHLIFISNNFAAGQETSQQVKLVIALTLGCFETLLIFERSPPKFKLY